MIKCYQVDFKYADAYSGWDWRKQRCTVEANSEEEAKTKSINLYGLGRDCDYEIISIKEYNLI